MAGTVAPSSLLEKVVVVEAGASEAPVNPALQNRLVTEAEEYCPEHTSPSPAAMALSVRIVIGAAVVVVGGVLYTLEYLGGPMAFFLGLLLIFLYVVIGGGSEWAANRLRLRERAELEAQVRASIMQEAGAPARSTVHRADVPAAVAGTNELSGTLRTRRVFAARDVLAPGAVGLVPSGVRPTSSEEVATFRHVCHAHALATGGHVVDQTEVEAGRSYVRVTIRYSATQRRDILLHTIMPYVAACESREMGALRFVDVEDLPGRLPDPFLWLSAGTLNQGWRPEPDLLRLVLPGEAAAVLKHQPGTLGEVLFNRFE